MAINARVPDDNPLDHHYPCIKDRYQDLEIAEDIIGNYALNEFPASIIITKKDGLLHLAIPAGGMSVMKFDGKPGRKIIPASSLALPS